MCFITIGTYANKHKSIGKKGKESAARHTGSFLSNPSNKILIELVRSLVEKKAETDQKIRELEYKAKKLEKALMKVK